MQKHLRQEILKAAQSQLGSVYKKDSRVPKSSSSKGFFDCVQFVGWCYEQALEHEVVFPLQGACMGFTDTRILDYLQALGAKKVSLADCQWGDIIVWNYRNVPHHTGMIYPVYDVDKYIAGEDIPKRLGVVHSCAKFGKVVAHPLSGEWALGKRLNSIWSLEHLF